MATPCQQNYGELNPEPFRSYVPIPYFATNYLLAALEMFSKRHQDTLAFQINKPNVLLCYSCGQHQCWWWCGRLWLWRRNQLGKRNGHRRPCLYLWWRWWQPEIVIQRDNQHIQEKLQELSSQNQGHHSLSERNGMSVFCPCSPQHRRGNKRFIVS